MQMTSWCSSSWSEIRRRKCIFCIGLFVCTFSVMIVTVIQTLRGQLGAVHIMSAEDECGQRDVVVKDNSPYNILNSDLLQAT